MRKIIAAEYLSLDGVVEDPGPAGDFEHRGWTMPYWNDELAKYQSDLLFASDALLLGRVTYEEFAASWPSRSGDPLTLGVGKRYFRDGGDKVTLTLTSAKTTSTGVVVLTYQPAAKDLETTGG